MNNVSSWMRSIIHLRSIASAMLGILCAGSLWATSPKEVSKLALACGKDDKKACDKLQRIASEDRDTSIRQLTVQAMENQAGLAKIGIGSKYDDTALEATRKVSDQTLLGRIALEGTSERPRSLAASKVVDAQVLTRILAASNDPAVHSLAQETLDWEAADRNGTVATYSEFLQNHPKTSRLRVDSATFAIGHIQAVSNSSSVSVGPNGEIMPTNFRTVITCEVMKDGRGTGDIISIDEAEKRGFLTRNPTTGSVTAVYKQVQRKLYKRASAAENANWVLVGDLKVVLEPDH